MAMGATTDGSLDLDLSLEISPIAPILLLKLKLRASPLLIPLQLNNMACVEIDTRPEMRSLMRLSKRRTRATIMDSTAVGMGGSG